MHPAGTADGRTAITIKKTIKHQELHKFHKQYLYCPPKHNIKNHLCNQIHSIIPSIG